MIICNTNQGHKMKLETYLKLNKLKQRDFAKIAGIDEAMMSRLINHYEIPKIKTIKIIEKATHGQVSWVDLVEHRVKDYRGK
jgi:transcriptional regulator with XRE-family HTH domain